MSRKKLKTAKKRWEDCGRKPSDSVADDEIVESCGCVFCDLDFKPEEHDGQLMHHVRMSKGRRLAAVPPKQWVPCTKPVSASHD